MTKPHMETTAKILSSMAGDSFRLALLIKVFLIKKRVEGTDKCISIVSIDDLHCFLEIWDDTHMTFMKIVQFSRPSTHPHPPWSKILRPP